ncbi:MAG: hypothetical protein K5675_07285 [Lachnospiraceae bacterium]|nr:hypothetical protein [Lachnospiraceae bacterium]
MDNKKKPKETLLDIKYKEDKSVKKISSLPSEELAKALRSVLAKDKEK